MIKEKLVIDCTDELDEGLEKAKRWKLLWFMMDGSTHFGYMIFPSEIEAQLAAEDFILNELKFDTEFMYGDGTGRIGLVSNISHFIPMPIGD